MSMERIKPTRSGLFAIELLIAVGVFSLCAAICVGQFVRSEVMSQDSADLNRAVAEARSAAECFKAVGGDLEKTAELTGGRVNLGPGTLYGAINSLLEKGWISLYSAETGSRRKKEYCITPAGRAAFRAELERLKELASNGEKMEETS